MTLMRQLILHKQIIVMAPTLMEGARCGTGQLIVGMLVIDLRKKRVTSIQPALVQQQRVILQIQASASVIVRLLAGKIVTALDSTICLIIRPDVDFGLATGSSSRTAQVIVQAIFIF